MKPPRYKDAHATDIRNVPGVLQWIVPARLDKPSVDRMVRLTRDNRTTFKALFGPRLQTFTSEFRFDVWRREHEGHAFWLLTAGPKGTAIEVEGMPPTEVVTSFLTALDQQIAACDAPLFVVNEGGARDVVDG